MTLGSTKFSSARFATRTTTSMIAPLGDPALAGGDDHRQPAAEEGADVRDVAADEVHHHDRQHERQAHDEGGHPTVGGDDGGHDRAALAVVPEDPTGVADEVVERVR